MSHLLKIIAALFLSVFVLSCANSSPTKAGTVIADAEADFNRYSNPSTVVTVPGTDSTKGTWTFGASTAGTYTAGSFTAFTNRSYDVGGFTVYGYIHAAGNQNPWVASNCNKPIVGSRAVRRWTSNYAGLVTITGYTGMDTDAQTLGGTGTRVAIYVDSVLIYTKDLVGTDPIQYFYAIGDISVAVGTKIDFVVTSIDASSLIANLTAKITI